MSKYVPRPPWPSVRPMPRQPDLSDGLCQSGRSPLPASAWTSADPAQREAATYVCLACPVLALCRAWSLRALPDADDTIVAAMDGAQRRRIRAARGTLAS